MFVAGSDTLHRFVASRLSGRAEIWVANVLSARDHARGTVFRMKPDVTVVDLDPVWNPSGLPLARGVTEACPSAHVILVAPDGYMHGELISTAARESGWSALIRRKGDTGERLMKAIVAGLGAGSWIDPDLTATGRGRPVTGGDSLSADGKRQMESDRMDVRQRVGANGSGETNEVDEWRNRARKGMGS
ncbi:MAG: hypothetical protein O3C10_10485 [Chloroflexi bacterium]|nr:hypothetical protein [Chloroflexota bacterium]